MTIRPDILLAHAFPETRQAYTKRDTILYALGIGLGRDPLDLPDLDYLLEDRLRALPTFAVTLGSLGMWIRDPQFGVDYAKLVHYEQAATFHAPLPPQAEIVAWARSRKVALTVAETERLKAELEKPSPDAKPEPVKPAEPAKRINKPRQKPADVAAVPEAAKAPAPSSSSNLPRTPS